jgi:hypothetical protein
MDVVVPALAKSSFPFAVGSFEYCRRKLLGMYVLICAELAPTCRDQYATTSRGAFRDDSSDLFCAGRLSLAS